MRRKLRNFLALNPSDRRRLLAALVLLPTAALGLRLFGLTRLNEMASRWFASRQSEAPALDSTARARVIARLVQIAARSGLYRGNCLTQSLTLLWLLQREGIPSELRIGVRKDAGELEAHAWVEVSGIPINDGDDVRTRYRPFDQLVLSQNVRFS